MLHILPFLITVLGFLKDIDGDESAFEQALSESEGVTAVWLPHDKAEEALRWGKRFNCPATPTAQVHVEAGDLVYDMSQIPPVLYLAE